MTPAVPAQPLPKKISGEVQAPKPTKVYTYGFLGGVFQNFGGNTGVPILPLKTGAAEKGFL